MNPALQLWLSEIKKAHHFVPESYWDNQAEKMRTEYFPKECYVYEKNEKIQGLILWDDDASILAIIVSSDGYRRGIGTKLLDFAKGKHEILFASVARANEAAVKFFEKNGFVELYTQKDVNTNEEELFMRWEKFPSEESGKKESQ